jgi:hypothetical protein
MTRRWTDYVPQDAAFLAWCLAAGALGAATIELLRVAWEARPMATKPRTQ